MPQFTDPLLRQIAEIGRRRYRTVFLITALLVIASLAAATRLRFDADVFHLLPPEAPQVELLKESLEEFGSIDYLLVAIRIPDESVLAPYEQFAERLGAGLEGLDELDEVQYRVEDMAGLVEEFLPRAMLFPDASGREEIERRLRPEALRRRAQELRRLLTAPQGLAMRDLILLDPLGLSPVLAEHLNLSASGLGFEWTSGYLLSRDHSMLLVVGKPTRPPQDLDFDRRLVEKVRAVVDRELEQWPGSLARPGTPPPRVELTGRHIIALGDARVIRRDALLNAVTALAGVLLLFLVAFRRLGPLLFAVLPLLCGLAFTFGFSALAVGTLSAATSGVAALLIGLGIDFVIVSYGRYVEERRRGAGLAAALASMSGSSGRAVVIGGLTSAATFYAFGVTEFVGLKEMGLLTGTGILLCMLAVLVLLPALLAWREEHHRRRRREARLYLHSFGTDRLIGFSVQRPVTVLVLGGLVTLAAGLAIPKLRFEDSLAAMRPAGNRAVALREEVAERFGAGFDQMMLVVDAATAEQALDRLDAAAAGAERLTRDGVLAGWDTLTRLLPPAGRQRDALAWLEELREERPPEAVRREFEAALTEAGLRGEPFARGLQLTVRALSLDAPFGLSELAASPSGRQVLGRYLRRHEGGWRGVVYLHPPPETWRREPPPAAERLADELGPHVHLVGANVVSEYLREQVKNDARVAAGLGLFLVAGLLWLDFRGLRETLLSLVPLLIGIVWMLGGMVALGIDLNFYNVFVSTMIIGIGVDYGIHMIHRYRECRGAGPEAVARGLRETGKAIALAAISTVVGFGSLTLSHFPGLRSTGAVAILGALATVVVALTVVPAFLQLATRRPRRPDAPPSS